MVRSVQIGPESTGPNHRENVLKISTNKKIIWRLEGKIMGLNQGVKKKVKKGC